MKQTALLALITVAIQFTGCSQKSGTSQAPTTAITTNAIEAQETPSPSARGDTKANQVPTADDVVNDPTTTPEKPRPLTKEDGLTCSFTQDLSSDGGSMYASANHFKCTNKEGKEVEIELISTDPNTNSGIEDGKVAIKTKDFGTVYRGNDDSTFNVYYMTDSQIEKLKKFLGF